MPAYLIPAAVLFLLLGPVVGHGGAANEITGRVVNIELGRCIDKSCEATVTLLVGGGAAPRPCRRGH